MTQLMLHGREVNTVFELLGNNENDMTYSLGWTLSKCNVFCQELAATLDFQEGFSNAMYIRLQEYAHQKGFTDIEIVDPGRVHIVIEAKRGYSIPSPDQLGKYADRLLASEDTKAKKMLIVLAESDRKEQWLTRHVKDLSHQLQDYVKLVEVKAISWKQFQKMAQKSIAKANHSQKRLLWQLIGYLEKVTTMQNQSTNYVYVAPLNYDVIFEDVGLSFIDVVEKHQKYFHPMGAKNYPAEPPNYIAFRYNGILQSIHHIESYTVIDDFQKDFNLPSPRPCGEHYLYELGPTIRPSKTVRTNDKTKAYKQIYAPGSNWCFIDLLLTCGSVAEAVTKTKTRCNGT